MSGSVKNRRCPDCGEPCYTNSARCFMCYRAFIYGRKLAREDKYCEVCDVHVTPQSRFCRLHCHSPMPTMPPELWVAVATEEARKLNLRPASVLSPTRTRINVLARTRAWVRLRAQGYALQGIGRASGFDHTTIMAGVRRSPALEEWHATGKRPPKLQHSIDAVLRNEARP